MSATPDEQANFSGFFMRSPSDLGASREKAGGARIWKRLGSARYRTQPRLLQPT